MPNSLLTILKTGIVTQSEIPDELPPYANGLPKVTDQACSGESCSRCVEACPTKAISVENETLRLDRGRCIGCGMCLAVCPTGTLAADRSVRVAVQSREELILSNKAATAASSVAAVTPFLRSMNIREVSTGDGASDMEAIASTNSLFDLARFGLHFVASPRFADALLVTGPVGRAMQEPLQRCFAAMAEPKMVIALGTSAIGGGLFAGGYGEADGLGSLLPVSCYIPGDPPHPWSIIDGLLLAMGRLKR